MWANPNYSTSHGVTTNDCVNQCPYTVAGQVTSLLRKIDFWHNAALSRNQVQNLFCVQYVVETT